MNVTVRFGIDRNHDRRIEPEEQITRFEQLGDLDQDEDGVLNGGEMEDLYFEFGEDVWLSGGERHHLENGQYRQTVELREVRLDPPAIDMHVQLSM